MLTFALEGWRHLSFLWHVILIKSYSSYGFVINFYKEEGQFMNSSRVLVFEEIFQSRSFGYKHSWKPFNQSNLLILHRRHLRPGKAKRLGQGHSAGGEAPGPEPGLLTSQFHTSVTSHRKGMTYFGEYGIVVSSGEYFDRAKIFLKKHSE